MQKLLQRSQQAKRAAARKIEKKKLQQEGATAFQRRRDLQSYGQLMTQKYKDARKARQTDWDSGLLAPRRDVGDQAKTYGTLDVHTHPEPRKPADVHLKWWHISEGDRVVITRGRDRGRIGVVDGVGKESNAVRVKGMNEIDMYVPEYLMMEEGREQLQTFSKEIPVQDVKLVYPLPDPVTGAPRDVVIDRLQCINRVWDKDKREWTEGERVIPGTNTIIPWPEKVEPVEEAYEDDTSEEHVQHQTFEPYLLQPPMPLSVIDELRNKYGKFRTRHEWEYVQRKEQEEERVERRQGLARTMRTPLQELAELRAQQKKSTERELSTEQLAKIGEVIARERAQVTGKIRDLRA